MRNETQAAQTSPDRPLTAARHGRIQGGKSKRRLRDYLRPSDNGLDLLFSIRGASHRTPTRYRSAVSTRCLRRAPRISSDSSHREFTSQQKLTLHLASASTTRNFSTTITRMRRTPEQWLEEAAPQKKESVFKLFLGYAPGVGKTYNMLSEAIRRPGIQTGYHSPPQDRIQGDNLPGDGRRRHTGAQTGGGTD